MSSCFSGSFSKFLILMLSHETSSKSAMLLHNHAVQYDKQASWVQIACVLHYIIVGAGASPPSRTTGQRCLYIIMTHNYMYLCIHPDPWSGVRTAVCQIPLIFKCQTLRQSKRYSNYILLRPWYTYTGTCTHTCF